MTSHAPKKTPSTKPAPTKGAEDTAQGADKPATKPGQVEELGGRDGPDPTRYGDWEYKGRCIDF